MLCMVNTIKLSTKFMYHGILVYTFPSIYYKVFSLKMSQLLVYNVIKYIVIQYIMRLLLLNQYERLCWDGRSRIKRKAKKDKQKKKEKLFSLNLLFSFYSSGIFTRPGILLVTLLTLKVTKYEHFSFSSIW